MADIIYKVAPPGEGKTRWLIERAEKEHNNGNRCYFLCSQGHTEEYTKFCDKYMRSFSQICPVMPLELYEELDSDCVVLIDEGMSHEFISSIVHNLKSRCGKIYMTLEGIDSSLEPSSMYKSTESSLYTQLSFID